MAEAEEGDLSVLSEQGLELIGGIANADAVTKRSRLSIESVDMPLERMRMKAKDPRM